MQLGEHQLAQNPAVRDRKQNILIRSWRSGSVGRQAFVYHT